MPRTRPLGIVPSTEVVGLAARTGENASEVFSSWMPSPLAMRRSDDESPA